MTLEEWIKKYNEKSPLPFENSNAYEMYYNPDKGFCEVGVTETMVIINQLCGDGRFWKDKVDRMARVLHIGHGGTWCVRPAVKAYIRLFGYRIVKDELLEDGNHRYHCLDKNNKEGLVSPSFITDKGEQAFFVTWEI